MSELLIEINQEEIPAFMQRPASLYFKQALEKELAVAEIVCGQIEVEIGPRRIMFYLGDLTPTLPQKHIELKGPRCDSPAPAIDGFCKANNISKEQLVIRKIKDIDCYFYEYLQPAQSVKQLAADIIADILKNYNWPKSMNWGAHEMRWVRPIRNILAMFDGEVIDFKFSHLQANNLTYGHRFTHHQPLLVTSWQKYKDLLTNNYVILSYEQRLSMIRQGLSAQATTMGLNVKIEERLLEEVAGLVEYPVVLMGKIDDKYMHIPSEMLITSMRTHQRFFPSYNLDGSFAPYFFFVSNLPNGDHKEIIAGNEKVLSARLADAAYFYTQDQKQTLSARALDLKNIIFHAKLGNMYEKMQRIKGLVAYLAPNDEELLQTASICKSDLTTEAVTEFPELQGIMGSYYAKLEGMSEVIVEAIKSHYKPQGNDDDIPMGKAAYLALADKIDSLVGLILAGERATGSKDPYALRRYALGIIKIIAKNELGGVSAKDLVCYTISGYHNFKDESEFILNFIQERLKYYLKADYSQELINAVVDFKSDDDIALIQTKLHLLANYIKTPIGQKSVQAYKRIASILSPQTYKLDTTLLLLPVEQELYNHINTHSVSEDNDFNKMLEILSSYAPIIDKFFDQVLVNDPDGKLQANRQALLQIVATQFQKFANFAAL